MSGWVWILLILALLAYAIWYFTKSRVKNVPVQRPYPNPQTAGTGAPLNLGRWLTAHSVIKTAVHYEFVWKCYRSDQTAGQDDPRRDVSMMFNIRGNNSVTFIHAGVGVQDRTAVGVTDADGCVHLTVMASGPDESPGSIIGVEEATDEFAVTNFEVRGS